MPKLNITTDNQTVKIEVQTTKSHVSTTVGHFSFGFQIIEEKVGWWWTTTNKKVYVSIPSNKIDQQLWDHQTFDEFLSHLKNGNNGFFLVGDVNHGLCFYTDGNHLVFGYGSINAEHPTESGLDIEFRVKLGQNTIVELEKLSNTLRI